jgi:hypothetical protein
MKQKNHNPWKYGILLFLFCIPAFYLLKAYSWLSISIPVKPDILVVEGWLSEDLLKLAKQEFNGKPYKLLITTGFPYWKGFQMGQDGKIVFKTSQRVKTASDSLYEISVTIRGTQCEGEFAHYRLFADTVMVADHYSTKQKTTVTSRIKLLSPPDSIIIEFDNDAYNKHSDRDLYIYSAAIGNLQLPVSSNNVLLYGSREGKYVFRRHLNSSTAKDAASFLISQNLPDSLVIPVETSHKIHSKTYTSALDVRQWLENNHLDKGRSVTVFTMGPHARRSLLCYRKAFGKMAETGVIACKDERITAENWYKSLRGWKDILYETAGLVYISIIPPARRAQF